MINDVMYGISNAIYAEFGDGYKIYTESIEQGLEEPCFLITCIKPKGSQYLGRRYLREHLFMIQYFSAGDEPRTECMDVQDRLYDALEFITVSGSLRNGTDMEGEVIDGVLNFQVNYKFFAERSEDGEYMYSIERNMEVTS